MPFPTIRIPIFLDKDKPLSYSPGHHRAVMCDPLYLILEPFTTSMYDYNYDYYYGFQSTPMPLAYYNPINNFANNPNEGNNPPLVAPVMVILGLSTLKLLSCMGRINFWSRRIHFLIHLVYLIHWNFCSGPRSLTLIFLLNDNNEVLIHFWINFSMNRNRNFPFLSQFWINFSMDQNRYFTILIHSHKIIAR